MKTVAAQMSPRSAGVVLRRRRGMGVESRCSPREVTGASLKPRASHFTPLSNPHRDTHPVKSRVGETAAPPGPREEGNARRSAWAGPASAAARAGIRDRHYHRPERAGPTQRTVEPPVQKHVGMRGERPTYLPTAQSSSRPARPVEPRARKRRSREDPDRRPRGMSVPPPSARAPLGSAMEGLSRFE